MIPVKRNYAFEVEGVPHGAQYCIKVSWGDSDFGLLNRVDPKVGQTLG
jgi:hypothetical protein